MISSRVQARGNRTGTGDWVDEARPKNWREGVLHLYPNGMAPLTAILSKMGQESVDDPEFNWWTKGLAAQRAAVTSIYLNPDLSTNEYVDEDDPVASGGSAGATLYVQISTEATCKEFRVGHQVLLRDASDYTLDVNAKVTAVVLNGTDSYLAVTLLEADDNSTAGTLADCDTVLVIGNINSEGAAMPGAIAYDPTKYYNYTQIFRTPLSITRTARKTKLRTGDQYREMKREALELHSIEMEKAYLWGIPTERVGSNGKPERTTGGLIYNIVNNGGNISDFTTQTVEEDVTWLDYGETWIDYELEETFRYGAGEKLAFCGSGVILAINKLIKEFGNYEFTPKTKSYGIQVTEWRTPFGVINLVTHPLFSFELTNRTSMVLFEPKDLTYRYIDDTSFYGDPDKKNTGRNRIDGTDEEFLTECGLEFHHPIKCAYFNGFGSDNGTP